jgi:hypothetical protein
LVFVVVPVFDSFGFEKNTHRIKTSYRIARVLCNAWYIITQSLVIFPLLGRTRQLQGDRAWAWAWVARGAPVLPRTAMHFFLDFFSPTYSPGGFSIKVQTTPCYMATLGVGASL